MPEPEDIKDWKKRSEIDYVPLFISSWLCLNVWMKSAWDGTDDRHLLNQLTSPEDNDLKVEFISLINGTTPEAIAFKGYFAELISALTNARLEYHKLPNNLEDTPNRFISFSNCIIDWNDGAPELETILKGERQHNKIEIVKNFWIDNDNNRVFSAYIEILYQVRCLLFHGTLSLIPANERVIINFYLTLSMAMKPLGGE